MYKRWDELIANSCVTQRFEPSVLYIIMPWFRTYWSIVPWCSLTFPKEEPSGILSSPGVFFQKEPLVVYYTFSFSQRNYQHNTQSILWIFPKRDIPIILLYRVAFPKGTYCSLFSGCSQKQKQQTAHVHVINCHSISNLYICRMISSLHPSTCEIAVSVTEILSQIRCLNCCPLHRAKSKIYRHLSAELMVKASYCY